MTKLKVVIQPKDQNFPQIKRDMIDLMQQIAAVKGKLDQITVVVAGREDTPEFEWIAKVKPIIKKGPKPPKEKKEEVCGVMIHTRGFGGMQGPLHCANKMPCKMHKKA